MAEKRELENPENPPEKKQKVEEHQQIDSSVAENAAETRPMEVDDEKQQDEGDSDSMELSDDSYVEPEEVQPAENLVENTEDNKPEQPPQFFLKKSVSFVEESIAKRKKSRNKLRRVPSYCKIWNGIKLEGDVEDEEDENMDEPPLLRRQSSWGPAVEKRKKRKLQERRQRLLGRLKNKLKTISREDLAAYKPTHVVWFDICAETGDETWYVVKLENHTFTEQGRASVLKVKFCGYSDEVWDIPAIRGDHSHIYWCHKVLLTSRFCDLGYEDNLNAVKSHLESLPRRRKKAGSTRRRRTTNSRRAARSGWGGTLNVRAGRKRSPSPPKGPPKEVTLKGVVTDASNASTKIKAKLKVLSHSTQRTVECESSEDGTYEVKVDTGLVKITCVADGYAEGEHLVHVYKDLGASNETEICLSKAIEDDGTIRIVLRWGHSPRDLDSHLYVPAMTKEEKEEWEKENPPADDPPAANPPAEGGLLATGGGLFGSSAVTSSFHGVNMPQARIKVSYQNKNYAHGDCQISLDRDVTTSFGPETVTISNMEALPKHIDYLEYIVHDYTGDNYYHLGKSKAIIYVYQKNKCQSYSVSSDQFVPGARFWHVFRINRETRTLETVNKFTKQYPTTEGLETVSIPYSIKPIAPKFDPSKFNQDQIQVVFSFDTTGSMYKCLATVRNYLKEIISKLLTEIPNLSIGLIAHGDYGDVTSSYVMKSIDLTRDVDSLCKFVNRVGETSGYDNDECYELVLHNITRDFSWDASCKYRSLVLIGDANPHPADSENNPFKIDWEKETDCCKENGIKIYGVHCLGTLYAEAFYRAITQKTGGLYVDLANLDEFVGMMTAICHREMSLALKEVEAGGDVQAVDEEDSPEKKRFVEECKKLEELTCTDLKEKLRKNRQKVSGSKQELVERVVDCKLFGCYPKCTECGGGRVKVIYDSQWTHNGEGQYYCNGYYDDDKFQHCHWRGTKADVVRPDWQD